MRLRLNDDDYERAGGGCMDHTVFYFFTNISKK